MPQLRNEILNQLGPKIVSETHPFDVGYLKGTTRVCMHSEDDLIEIWHKIGRGEACALWCDGVVEGKSSSKRPVTTVSQTWDSSSESDAEDSSKSTRRKKKKKLSALEEKNARIEEFIVQLKDKHKDSFNRIQYRLWAEMLDVGTHKSLDEAPNAPMFSNTGIKHGKSSQTSALTNAFTEMASSIALAFSQSNKPSSPTGVSKHLPSSSSPGKLVELRGKYIQQLRELHSLFEGGALSELEFVDEKESILRQLKMMSPPRQ